MTVETKQPVLETLDDRFPVIPDMTAGLEKDHKYFVYLDDAGAKKIVIFSADLDHYNVASVFCDDVSRVVSGGYVTISDLEILCWGRADTLDRDANVLDRLLVYTMRPKEN